MTKPYNRHQDDETDREVMDDRQAAVFLGLSTKSLRKLRQNNKIPFARIGGLIRYRRTTLLAPSMPVAQAKKDAKNNGLAHSRCQAL